MEDRYQVLGGPTRDNEFEEYVNVLRELGLSLERDRQGRLGVVDSEEMANRILDGLWRREATRWIAWMIVPVP